MQRGMILSMKKLLQNHNKNNFELFIMPSTEDYNYQGS